MQKIEVVLFRYNSFYFIVLASSTTLSCGVSVDHVSEIRIETTTKVLFVDAAPVRMVVEGFNKEGWCDLCSFYCYFL